MGVLSGLGCAPPATRPAKCAMSTIRIGADLVGDGAEAREVDDARIGRAAGDDDARPVLARELRPAASMSMRWSSRRTPYCTALNHLPDRLGAAPCVRCPPRRQRQAEDRVAGPGQRQQDRLVGLAAGIRLHIGEVAVEQLLGAIDGQRFGFVDELAAAVVAPARIALGIFVGERRAGGLQHRPADDILRGDQLDLVALPVGLAGHGGVDRRVGRGAAPRQRTVLAAQRRFRRSPACAPSCLL